ncbi:MAG: YvrJ family protein [Lactobacillus johnsonii]|nr:YvrJ family protein [Lactobacillus johnsonii]MDO5007450.1 YvrJ family protein [Lactobacillus johnsonii]
MTQEIIKYVLEQASGVVIALVLLIHIESKLDSLTSAIMHLSDNKAQYVRLYI